MLTIEGVSEELEKLYSSYKSHSARLFSSVRSLAKLQEINPDTDILEQAASDHVIYIVEGYFRLRQEKKIVRLFSENDFVDIHDDDSRMFLDSEFKTEVAFIFRKDLERMMAENHEILNSWLVLKNLENKINLGLCAFMSKERVTPSLCLKQFRDGERIINENEEPTEIFELISGEAAVSCNEVEVGTINRGEIFGEIGILADSPRHATVTAKGHCSVQVVPKEDFISMLTADTHLCNSLARTLAKRIIALNERVAKN